MPKSTVKQDPEFAAMSAVYAAIKDLQPEIQTRVLKYVADKLNLTHIHTQRTPQVEELAEEPPDTEFETVTERGRNGGDELEGISPVARKWLTRNDITPKQLMPIFSIGGDEIDLIAEDIPGGSGREKVRNIFLLKGIAAYLGAGAARITHEQVKEACLHYDAYDATNFAKYVKNLSGDISGGKDSGYALTPRGMADAGKLVKDMIKKTVSD
jgi:hypothetical protein